MPNDMNGSESVYGLLAWLTCRNEETILSAHHNANPAVEIAKKFCEANDLEPIRESKYPANLTHPVN